MWPALNIYKSPITDLNEPFESDLGGNTMGEEWPCKGAGSGEKGNDYVARECLGCWGAEEAKTEGGRRWRGGGGMDGALHSSLSSPPPSPISQDCRCEVTAKTQSKATWRSLIIIGPQPNILTSDTQAHIWGTASWHITKFLFGPLWL